MTSRGIINLQRYTACGGYGVEGGGGRPNGLLPGAQERPVPLHRPRGGPAVALCTWSDGRKKCTGAVVSKGPTQSTRGPKAAQKTPPRAPFEGGGGPGDAEFLEAPRAPKKNFDRPKARKKIWPNLLGGGGSVVCPPPPPPRSAELFKGALPPPFLPLAKLFPFWLTPLRPTAQAPLHDRRAPPAPMRGRRPRMRGHNGPPNTRARGAPAPPQQSGLGKRCRGTTSARRT